MNKTKLAFALALLFLTSCTKNESANPSAERIAAIENGLTPSRILASDTRESFNIYERMAKHNVPGVSIAVIRNNEIEWAKGYGLRDKAVGDSVTSETLFQAASISKPVAAVGALTLVEAEKVALDENVNDQMKSWRLPENGLTESEKVTLRRLVSHSAGLTVHGFRGYAKGENVPSTTEVLDGNGPANSAPVRVDLTPGSEWRYSGGGYTVMQLLAQDVSGEGFVDFMQKNVLDKIGMNNSSYEQPLPEAKHAQAATGYRGNGKKVTGDWHTYPEMAAAGLWTTPTDLAKFAIEIIKANAGESKKVISQEMTQKLLERQSGNYGLGVSLRESGAFGHGGANEGFRCMLIAYPDRGEGAAVMTNSDNGGALAAEILNAVSAAYDWPDYKPEILETATISQERLEQHAGEYFLEDNSQITLTLKVGENKLIAKVSIMSDAMIFHPQKQDEFFTLSNPARLHFPAEGPDAVIRGMGPERNFIRK